MILRPPLRKVHLLAAARNLRMYSRVNQAMQTASTVARAWLSRPVRAPASSRSMNSGSVFRQSAMVETRMTEMLTPATTCKTETKIKSKLVK